MRAVEPARDDLISRCVWNQVARELLDDELVVGLVFAEGLDHPIAPEPHLAARIHVNARRVGVARDVEPRHGEALRSARCVRLFGEEAIHKLFVAVRARVGDVGVGFARRWWQACEIEVDAAHEVFRRGFRTRFDAHLLQAREHEAIDVAARP